MNKVRVRFGRSNREYTYLLPEWIDRFDLSVGTKVVVPTSVGYYEIGEVRRIGPDDYNGALKSIVCIVDDSDYKKMIVDKARRDNLERQLKKRLAEVSRNDWLDMLKAKDPESMNLIREYEGLLK